jgi:hypothetical protein
MKNPFGMEDPMTATFINQTSRVAIAGRVAQSQRQFRGWDEWMLPGDYHFPFGPTQARVEAAKWLCQV